MEEEVDEGRRMLARNGVRGLEVSFDVRRYSHGITSSPEEEEPEDACDVAGRVKSNLQL